MERQCSRVHPGYYCQFRLIEELHDLGVGHRLERNVVLRKPLQESRKHMDIQLHGGVEQRLKARSIPIFLWSSSSQRQEQLGLNEGLEC